MTSKMTLKSLDSLIDNWISIDNKHRDYVCIHESLRPYIRYRNSPDQLGRAERERFLFIKDRSAIEGARIADIGGNTGFFTISYLLEGAQKVSYFETEEVLCEFVDRACQHLGLRDRVEIVNAPFNFQSDAHPLYDYLNLLNVIHHVGEDFDTDVKGLEAGMDSIFDSLRRTASYCENLVMQMSFLWKGDPALPMFQSGTKGEMIGALDSALHMHYSFSSIGIYGCDCGASRYSELTAENISRKFHYREFFNRPIFIMKSILNKGTRNNLL
jgi:hypothetical protein